LGTVGPFVDPQARQRLNPRSYLLFGHASAIACLGLRLGVAVNELEITVLETKNLGHP
jgi:hypothetical protein